MVLVLGLVLTSLSGCITPAQPKVPGPRAEIVVAITEDITSFDPQIVTGAKSSALWNHIYGALLRTDANQQPHPDLAVSYEIVDSLRWRFHLRQGVTFHNGEPFDANAVTFTLNRIREPARKAVYAADYKLIDRIEVIDPYTIDIVTLGPWPDLPLQICGLQILPPGYLAKAGDNALRDAPVGTGPYRFVEWVRDERMVLEANPDYWDGRPAIARVVFRVIPEAATQVAALLTGEVDLIDTVPIEVVDILRRNPNIQVYAGPTLRVVFCGLDAIDGGPLADQRVRQALNYAVNVDAILEHVLSGFGRRVATLAAPVHAGFDASVTPYRYDPAKARELLAEAGYPNGFPIKLQAGMGDWMPIAVAEAIASDLQAIGVSVKLVQVEKGLHIETLLSRDGDPPAYMLSLGGVVSRFQTNLDNAVSSKGRYSYFADPELDRMIAEAAITVNVDARNAIFSRLQNLVKERAPMIFLYQLQAIFAARSRVRDWEPRADGLMMVNRASVSD
jgi:peptide/nickel transport system substrate-binding protein